MSRASENCASSSHTTSHLDGLPLSGLDLGGSHRCNPRIGSRGRCCQEHSARYQEMIKVGLVWIAEHADQKLPSTDGAPADSISVDNVSSDSSNGLTTDEGIADNGTLSHAAPGCVAQDCDAKDSDAKDNEIPDSGASEANSDSRLSSIAFCKSVTRHISAIHKSSLAEKVCAFGIAELDEALPRRGLPCGAVHEFFLRLPETANLKLADRKSRTSRALLYPRTIPATLACSLWKQQSGNAKSSASPLRSPPYIFWIGRRSWPTPFLLEQLLRYRYSSEEIFSRCILVDPPNYKAALWSIEAALKTPGVGAVIAECDKLSLTTSRRFALAARSSGAIGFFLRPYTSHHLTAATASYSKWLLCPAAPVSTRSQHLPGDSASLLNAAQALQPLWKLELLRLKGSHSKRTEWYIEIEETPAAPFHENYPEASLSEEHYKAEEYHEATLSLRISSFMGDRALDPGEKEQQAFFAERQRRYARS